MKWALAGPLVGFIALVGLLAAGLTRDPHHVPSPLIGRPAPPFAAPTLDAPAERWEPAALRGRVWVLNVWASWCGPCREEHPLWLALARRQPGLPIVGLNHRDNREAAREWLARWGNPYSTSVSDPEGLVGLDYGVYGLPETFVIDAQGIVRYKHVGPLTARVVRDELEPAIQRWAP